MSVNPRDARVKLIEALRIVRDRQASSADNWEFSQLRTFVKYLEAIGIDPDLRLPVWTMYIAKWNETQKARRRKAGKPGTPMPFGKMAAMAFAAAAVTALKGKGPVDMVLRL